MLQVWQNFEPTGIELDARIGALLLALLLVSSKEDAFAFLGMIPGSRIVARQRLIVVAAQNKLLSTILVVVSSGCDIIQVKNMTETKMRTASVIKKSLPSLPMINFPLKRI